LHLNLLLIPYGILYGALPKFIIFIHDTYIFYKKTMHEYKSFARNRNKTDKIFLTLILHVKST
jgi:hypothetical protein